MYAQAGLSLCWSHIPHCWKSHVAAHLFFETLSEMVILGCTMQFSHDSTCIGYDLDGWVVSAESIQYFLRLQISVV